MSTVLRDLRRGPLGWLVFVPVVLVAVQIAVFVAPVQVFASHLVAPEPMDLDFGGGQVLTVMLTTLTVSGVVACGRSASYPGVQLLAVYSIFAVTLLRG